MAMSPLHKATCVAERYDQAQQWARDTRLPPGAPRPQLTAAWPPGNVQVLERFRAWLLSSGTSPYTVDYLYLPMAGHVLGLTLKPAAQLDLDADLQKAMDYVRAKRLSAQWTQMCRNALGKFRLFLRQERGAADPPAPPISLDRYRQGLPAWLARELERYQHVLEHHWRPSRLKEETVRFWSGHTRLWRWLLAHHPIGDLCDLRRQYLLDYVDQRLQEGYAVSTVNTDLRSLRGFLLFLQENDYPVPQALLRMPRLKPPDALPKFLTDEQVRLLRDEVERRVAQARYPMQKRDALLDRAAFYLLWQSALRLGEVEDLRLEELDLPGRRLIVRRGKGMKDRTVYLTDTAVAALHAYLAVRGAGPTSHVFLFRNLPVKKDLLHSRVKQAGERVGVKVYPHRLRHTCATQLLNAGCRITSIQKILGHQRLNSTMTYARVHDRTVADEFYRAMAEIEKHLDLKVDPPSAVQAVGEETRLQLLDCVSQLAVPDLEPRTRLQLVERMRLVLTSASSGKVGAPLAV